MKTEALARLIIYVAALLAWTLKDKDREVFDLVKDNALLKWQVIKEGGM